MKDTFHVAVIGAGMAGLFVGEQLRQAGIAHTIFEKASEVGGTWHANTYPGLHVDVLTRSYEFPFARYHGWSKRFAPGSEIQSYLTRISRERRIIENIIFDCEIGDARFVDGRWALTAKDGRAFTADVLIAATGFLRVPSIPRIEGRESFAGPAFHSAAWDHSVDLRGKRVGVIGTGSSGVQIVTELGQQGVDVVQFVRTPQWMMVRKNPKISWFERLMLRIPHTARLMDAHMRRLRVKVEGPASWRFEPGPDRDRARAQYASELIRAVPDEALRAKLTPTELAGCKRIAKTEHYYDVVQQPNVELVVGPLTRIEPEGVVDGEGKLHPLDVLVYATGFDSHAYMRPMHLEGPAGHTIDELWKDSVYAYYGVAVPHMPNFFMLNGPFAPINLIPIPALLQDEYSLIGKLIELIRDKRVAIAPTVEATMRFCGAVREALPPTTFAECNNWFTDQSGLPIVWPWPAAEHGRRLAAAPLEDFEMMPLDNMVAAAAEPIQAEVGA